MLWACVSCHIIMHKCKWDHVKGMLCNHPTAKSESVQLSEKWNSIFSTLLYVVDVKSRISLRLVLQEANERMATEKNYIKVNGLSLHAWLVLKLLAVSPLSVQWTEIKMSEMIETILFICSKQTKCIAAVLYLKWVATYKIASFFKVKIYRGSLNFFFFQKIKNNTEKN